MQSINDPDRQLVNPNPKWPVPIELIEWQPAYTQKGAVGLDAGQWAPDWEDARTTKCGHLIARLRQLLESSTASEKVHQQSPVKVIVFSQYWMHVRLVATSLEQEGIKAEVFTENMKPSLRHEALANFQDDSSVVVLVMDKAGSVGLDLSFVSSVILMEPLNDPALEQQVVSRAHRMGARQPIYVETLVMKGTAEEDILRRTGAVATESGVCAAGTIKVSETDRRVCNSLLASLQRVHAARQRN